MPNTKKISLAWNETGKTVYAIIRREADLFRLNDADGSFAANPADPYLALAEDAVIKGLYEVSEARKSWNDGKYFIFVYRQTGASPVPANDMMIGSSKMSIISDTEVDFIAIDQINAAVDAALDTAIPGSPTADSINERIKAIDNKLPSRDYLAGSTDATGAVVDKTGYVLASGATNSAIIAGAIWDALIADYGTVEETFGYILKAIIAEAEESALFTGTPTDAELCTLALYELGQEGINNFNDGTKRSTLCKYFYPIVRDAVLRAYPWNFAIARQTLARDEETPLSGYAYSYTLPVDPYCLRALEINEDKNDIFKIEGRHLYTDEGTVKLKYIKRVTNPGLYDALFRETLVQRLASVLAYPITRQMPVAKDHFILYKDKLQEARTISGMEGTIDEYESDDLTSVR